MIELIKAEATGLAEYHLRIMPTAWRLTQQCNHRVFQRHSVPAVVSAVLQGSGVPHRWDIQTKAYPQQPYRMQHGESDFAFISRLLEEAGIAYLFENDGTMVLSDKLHAATARAEPLTFVDNPNQAAEFDFVAGVSIRHAARVGTVRYADYDFRRPRFPLRGTHRGVNDSKLESYRYAPGGFVREMGKGGGASADDRGENRHDDGHGAVLAKVAMEAESIARRVVGFETNAIDLGAGTVFRINNEHPQGEIEDKTGLLVTDFNLVGGDNDEWFASGEAVFADEAYRPPQSPLPRMTGVQSATVVSPDDSEISTDEFGRVRVIFPWEGKEGTDSCWLRVSQGWGGAGYGMLCLPRTGEEVLVGFLNGEPDQPIIVGRVFNAVQKVPYALPQHKTRSVWRSDSSPGHGGYNELMFEDAASNELVNLQAQRNMRQLIKNDHRFTIGNDRHKVVRGNELDYTQGKLVEVIGGDHCTTVNSDREIHTKGHVREVYDSTVKRKIAGGREMTISTGDKVLVEGDAHQRIGGGWKTKVEASLSFTVGADLQQKAGGKFAVESGGEIHIKSGATIVIEAASGITLKGPGGFVSIDAGGVAIQGSLVKINSGGSAASGGGCSPEAAEEPSAFPIEQLSLQLEAGIEAEPI